MTSFWLYFFCLCAPLTILANDCFFPNGNRLPDTDGFAEVQPCKYDPVRTICCSTNRRNPSGGDWKDGFTADICLPNGLCQVDLVDKGVSKTRYWVEYCTNSNITSGDCLDICLDQRGDPGTTMLTPCDGTALSEKWCCGTNTTCCASGVGVVQLPRNFARNQVHQSVSSDLPQSSTTKVSVDRTSSSSVLTQSIPPTQSNSGTSTSTPAPSSTPVLQKSSLSIAAGAGIGIGAGSGVICIAAVTFFMFRRLSGRRKGSKGVSASWARGLRPAESELPTSERPVELPPQSPSELYGSFPGHKKGSELRDEESR